MLNYMIKTSFDFPNNKTPTLLLLQAFTKTHFV